jgi:PAS domain S-box-containing protein/putative nucleotidyltransferase with HDIG domain
MIFKWPRKHEGEIFSALVKNSTDGIYILAGNRFEYVNPAFEALTGYSESELLNPVFDLDCLIFPEDLGLIHDRMDSRTRGEGIPALYEFRIVNKAGAARTVEVNTSQLSGNGGRVLGIMRETTARKQAEQSLMESEEKYRHLVERASDGIAIVQNDLIKYVNPRAAQLGGFKENDLLDAPFSRYLATDDVETLNTNQDLGAPGTNIRAAGIKHKEGTTVSVELNAGTITYQGKPASLIILRDVSDRKRTEEELNLTLEKLRKAMGATIQAMSLTIETRDPYTAGHQKRVSDLARAIATEMGMTPENIDAIRMAAAIHDLGKISIPAEILSKPGRISEFEFRLIQNHPQIGYEILRTIEFPWPIAEIVLQHHERMNGSGYPAGLKGDRIHLISRILAVADVVEAMVSHRPYRSALTLGEALYEITKNRGILYDPNAVDACRNLFVEGRFAFR